MQDRATKRQVDVRQATKQLVQLIPKQTTSEHVFGRTDDRLGADDTSNGSNRGAASSRNDAIAAVRGGGAIGCKVAAFIGGADLQVDEGTADRQGRGAGEG